MPRYFSLLLILALLPGGFASGGEAVDRETVAKEVLSILGSGIRGFVSEPDLERFRLHANPQNATATIEIIPDLLHNEKEYRPSFPRSTRPRRLRLMRQFP